MQAIPDKEFNEIFRRKLGEFEVQPSAAVWNGIVAQLDKKTSKKALPVFWLSIAASLLVVLSATLWLLSPKDPIMLKGRPETVTIVRQQEVIEDVMTPDEELAAITILEDSVLHPESLPVSISPGNLISDAEKQVEESPEKLIEVGVNSSKDTPVAISSIVREANIEPLTAQVENPPVVAFAAKESASDYSKALSSQRRSKGGDLLGNLVNYVVGKVDPRQDKIVEITEDGDGGSEISSINLGFLKIKNGNK